MATAWGRKTKPLTLRKTRPLMNCMAPGPGVLWGKLTVHQKAEKRSFSEPWNSTSGHLCYASRKHIHTQEREGRTWDRTVAPHAERLCAPRRHTSTTDKTNKTHGPAHMRALAITYTREHLHGSWRPDASANRRLGWGGGHFPSYSGHF